MIDVRRIFRITRMIVRTFRQYHWRFLLLTALGLTAGIFGGIGITAVIPLFSLFAAPHVGAVPDTVTRFISGFFSVLHLPFTPPLLLGFIVLLFIVKAYIQFLSKYLTDKNTLEFAQRMQQSLFTNTLQAAWPYLFKQKVGYLERFILNDARNAAGMLGLVGNTIMLGTSMMMYGAVALSISTPITFATATFGVLMFLAVKPVFAKIRRLNSRLALLEKITNHYITENIIGMKLVKAFRSEILIGLQGKKYFAELFSLNTRQVFYSYMTGAFAEPAGFAFIAVLFLLSYRKPGFNIVAFGVIMYLVQRVFSFVQSLQGQLQTINGMVPYLQTVMQYRRDVRQNKEQDEGTKDFQFNRLIEFQHISFAYEQDRMVLSDISFSIEKGNMLGIVGPSGAGKTTIVDLLLRLLAPTDGSILVDGVLLTDIRLAHWRQNIGYVPQEIFLLNETIENNIRFYGESISDEAVKEAVQLANASEFVDKLPEGIKTIVGERGTKLSGGQRQRIALARALARKPEILILDEATSNLDAASESLIQKAIFGIKGRVTIVVIAHRLGMLEHADQIVTLREGRISSEEYAKSD